MSLDWKLTGIADYEKLCWEYNDEGERTRLNPVTDAIIWYMMFTDIGWELTAKNADEFYKRIQFFNALNDSIITYGDGKPRTITLDEVKAHIGLHVNVAPLTRNKWAKRITDVFMDRTVPQHDRYLTHAATSE